MARLRMMRAPQKIRAGKGFSSPFPRRDERSGDKWLFICSNSGHKMCHDKIEKSFEGTTDIRRYENLRRNFQCRRD